MTQHSVGLLAHWLATRSILSDKAKVLAARPFCLNCERYTWLTVQHQVCQCYLSILIVRTLTVGVGVSDEFFSCKTSYSNRDLTCPSGTEGSSDSSKGLLLLLAVQSIIVAWFWPQPFSDQADLCNDYSRITENDIHYRKWKAELCRATAA